MNQALTPEQIKAARALVAWSQQELATRARVATSTVADFERGVRTPVANNAQAIREALEGEGLQFLAGGVINKALLPQPPQGTPASQGALLRWISATDLSQWAERYDGRSGMPELLRRLIFAEHGPAASVHFPSDESIQYPGYDGTCSVVSGSAFVPDGDSVWEIGSQREKICAKAGGDFAKRTKNPLGRDPKQTAFVFVTPQRFPGKDAWVAKKKALRAWRDVTVIDGDALVHWLEAHPAVAQWLAVRIGRRPQGLRNLEEVWEEWVRATTAALTPDVLLTDRDETHIAVLKWLRGAPQLIAVQADAPDEAMAFFYAAMSPLPEAYRLSHLGRCVVADSAETARQLVGLGTPLIIVLINPEAGLVRRLVDDGHHVFAACDSRLVTSFGAHRLARPWRFHLQEVLIKAGLSEEQAHRLAHASGRSITVLRRLMPAAPISRHDWAVSAPPDLIAAMFAGAWVGTNPADRRIVAALAGCDYDQLEAALAPLAAKPDSPIVRLGNVWKIASLHDLWTQIGSQVTSGQFARYERAFQEVLGAINPRFAKRPKSKYYEEEGEFGEEASPALRDGLTEAMIAVSVYPERAELVVGASERAEHAVRTLLQKASPALWWSLSRDFRNLAEAAPAAFLEALETGLEGDDPAIMSLFRSDEGLMHPTEHLSNLLWALEMLARSPTYLSQAASILARLDELDPGGKWANRPFASLRQIFVTWFPQTYATSAQRLRVIDRLLRDHPEVGWKLLVAIAPKLYDTSNPTAMPNWRDFAPDQPETITWASAAETSRAIGERLLDSVGGSVERWQTLFDLWANVDSSWRQLAVARLQEFATALNEPAQIEPIHDSLRALLDKHRAFKDADWAMDEEDLQPLDQVFHALQLAGVEARVRWLFRPRALGLKPGVDFRASQNELEARQRLAAEDLLAELQPDALFDFMTTITMHHALGVAVGNSDVPNATKQDLLKRGLCAKNGNEADFGVGVLWALKVKASDNGDEWIRQLWARAISEDWGTLAEMRIVFALPMTLQTWNEVEARSAELTDAYWRHIPVYQIPGGTDPLYVEGHMSAVDRSHDAVAWFGHHISTNPPGALLVETLRAAAKSTAAKNGNDAVMMSHWLGVIFNYLDSASDVTEKEVVELEWIYFQALRYSQRPARTLHRALARDPELFSSLLKMIYMPAEDSGVKEPAPEDMEGARKLAAQAYDILRDWALVPGSDDQGHIDQIAIEEWVKRARKLLVEAGRGEIGDSKIGAILSAAATELGQPWPPRPVREIIDTVRSRALERGFESGVYNRRGVTVRMPLDGGKLERELAARYRADAETLRLDDWQRTAACLDRIAEMYEADAAREDLAAQQRDWL